MKETCTENVNVYVSNNACIMIVNQPFNFEFVATQIASIIAMVKDLHVKF